MYRSRSRPAGGIWVSNATFICYYAISITMAKPAKVRGKRYKLLYKLEARTLKEALEAMKYYERGELLRYDRAYWVAEPLNR
jgi:hypothetical protein